MVKTQFGKVLIVLLALLAAALLFSGCEMNTTSVSNKYFINDNEANQFNKDPTTKDDAIDRVTEGITNLRTYLDSESISTTGYYMGMEFNIDAVNPITLEGGNFRLKIQAHLFTYPYLDEDGNMIYKWYDKKDGKYYDEQSPDGTRVLTKAEDIHNQVIKKSDIVIEWYNGTTNEMLIGMYFDGLNSNSEDPGNMLYMNIQGHKRSFPEFGDKVLYRQMVRLLMSLSVEKLLTAGNIQGDGGVSIIEQLFTVAVTDNYKLTLNDPVTSVLFYGIAADMIAGDLTDFVQNMFKPFEDKIDPLTYKYLGFRFSVIGNAVINSILSDMQFFSEPDPAGVRNIMTGAYLTFQGAALAKGAIYNYTSDVSFEYDIYPPEDMKLDRDYYDVYQYGKYEFDGNLYIPMLNSNFDASILTDMQRHDNSTNNVYMAYRDIANGELMIGAYYKNERTYVDISGMEYLYGWIDLNELGFPKVYDEHLNLAEALDDMFNFIDDTIISIVDGILSPDQNDKKNYLLEHIMAKTSKTEKIPGDIFSKNTVTLTVDMILIKQALFDTGQGVYTTRDIINILDTMLPITMDQMAIMLGIASAEVMLDNSYFTFTLDVDTNEITIKLFTDVGIKEGEPSTLIFQLDLIPVVVGREVNIAEVNVDGFKPLQQIMTYSATMNGNFIFSASETVDLSKLLSATIGENSGLNTPYQLATNAGITFELTYDQFVTDHIVEGIERKQGRSAFELNVWLTGMESEIVLSLVSDDVAFNNEVYGNQPERASELGFVWVNIACIKDNATQRIPKIKVREDIFMSSMQAYLDGTSIADDAAELGKTEVNLSITSILFALIEDSYVVMEPEQLEITSSNETLQNLFRVKGLIGNIRTNAGFSHRVKGLQSVKNDYGMFKVGMFTDMQGNSPYDTVLHNNVPIYFYNDFNETYNWLEYDFRVDARGVIQVYEKGGRVVVSRMNIDYASDSFFNDEDANNQDISRVRFNVDSFPFIRKSGEKYLLMTYSGEEREIESQYIRIENSIVYVYYEGIKDRVQHAGGADYVYFDANKAIFENNERVFIHPNTTRQFLFEYEQKSIEITERAKTQYAPRINGSFMGEIRRYILVMTSPYAVERGKLLELASKEFYNKEDEENKIEIYDDNGILVKEEAAPIVLFVMEPAEVLQEEVEVVIQVNNNNEYYTLPAKFVIDWEAVTLKGYMEVTEVIVAPGTMGERKYPVRIIVTNREISHIGTTEIYTTSNDNVVSEVPVVDEISIDPFDYILAKNEFFMDISNYNPAQYGTDAPAGQDPEYVREFKKKEIEFINRYFSQFNFSIHFDFQNSWLHLNGVQEKYIQTSYNNTNAGETFMWNFDKFKDGTNRENKISPSGANLYLHSYFKGQLVALRLKVEKREFSHIKFGENDTFDVEKANEGKDEDEVKIYGHYVANYFDVDSYKIPTDPIFVFTDGENNFYERVFNMPFVNKLTANGNYNIKDAYDLQWERPEITYVGSNGSYYLEGDKYVNRPFYIGDIIRDENGNIIQENEPNKSEGRDFTGTTLSLLDLLAIYKPRYEQGVYNGKFDKINLIEGISTDTAFPSIVLNVTVECPMLDVADATTSNGQPIVEADDKDTDVGGNPVSFTPSAIEIGKNTVGYYQIDPLNATTGILPDSFILHFTNADGSKTSTHKYSNIEWRANFEKNAEGEYFGDGSMQNASGVTVIRRENGRYVFDLSTEKPMTTRVMAKIGSRLSGFKYVTLCVKVLSKDPQSVEFYFGGMPSGTRIDGIERTDVSLDTSADGTQNFIYYTYYADTFADFKMPTWIKAYFGLNKERSENYSVTWTRTNGGKNIAFTPNSVQNLVTTIGDGDISIKIYLSVVVANHTIKDIEFNSSFASYYVQIGGKDYYEQIGALLQKNLHEGKIGLYRINGYVEEFVLISTGSAEDNRVPAGKIGLYNRLPNGDMTLVASMYPYDFVQSVYSNFNIYFESGQPVALENAGEFYTYFSSEGTDMPVKLSNAAKLKYVYDASGSIDRVNVELRYEDADTRYELKLDQNGFADVYPNSNMNPAELRRMTPQELTILLVNHMMSEDIDGESVNKFVTRSGEIELPTATNLKTVYRYANGVVSFINPADGTAVVPLRVVFSSGRELSYEELVYRLTFINKHRLTDYTVAAIRARPVEIGNLEGIFAVNDVVRSATDSSFVEKAGYKIRLGTGAGSYDLTVRLVFDGGYRSSTESGQTTEIVIQPYSDLGHAQYGSQGYVLGYEISATVTAVRQNGEGVSESFYYGPAYGATAAMLTKWYVESSTFADIKEGTFITAIPQSVVYSAYSGTVVISCLTAEGFRIRRMLVFNGVPEQINEFNSTNTSGLLIRGGTITIRDIYEYLPLTEYFGGTRYLPTTMAVNLGGRNVNVSNVSWKISGSWYGDTVTSGGQVVGNGFLDKMTYNGTYNTDAGVDDKKVMATAEILGWEQTIDGKKVMQDRIKVSLYISVHSAEIESLPWNTGKLNIDTTTLVENGEKIFCADVDAYNDAQSSAIVKNQFFLPVNLTAKYRSGITHTFRNAIYSFKNIPLTYIPYGIRGIDVEKLAAMTGLSESSFNSNAIDVQVNVGLNQILNLRLRFPNKSVDSVSAVINLNDDAIRASIASAMSGLSTAKIEEINARFNQTRIKTNVEKFIEQARAVRDDVGIVNGTAFYTQMSLDDIKRVLVSAWDDIYLYDGVTAVEDDVRANLFSYEQYFNFALTRMRTAKDRLIDVYAPLIRQILASDSLSPAVKVQNINKQISVYNNQLYNESYDAIIGDYLKIEFNRAFVKDATAMSSYELGYISGYKNEVEGSLDVGYIIREVYRVREYIACGIIDVNTEEGLRKVESTLQKVFFDTIQRAFAAAKAASPASNAVIDNVNKVFMIKLGLDNSASQYKKMTEDVNYFISNHLYKDKREMRFILNDLFGKAMDFSLEYNASDLVSQELEAIYKGVVDDNVNAIQNYATTISSIRRNLNSGVDIASLVKTILNRGVTNFVNNAYLESKVAVEIKKVQALQAKNGNVGGYYYIDPYYDYTVIPTTFVADFGENNGGFAHYFTAAWTNDIVSNSVSYVGNAKSDMYGYVYSFYNAYSANESNILLNSLLQDVQTGVVGKSWEEIKTENASIYNTLLLIERLVDSFFGDVTAVNREERTIQLYHYYVAGGRLYAMTNDNLNTADVDAEKLRRDYDKHKYTELNAGLLNQNTGENQVISLVAHVLNRTLAAGDLIVRDEHGNAESKVVVHNPFEYTASDLPHFVNVDGETLEIIWNNVSISPLGNINASTHTVYGNIKNSNGQGITLELYVSRWEYAGVYRNVGGKWVLMNPMNFYFSPSLIYSAEDEYRVRFFVTNAETGEKVYQEKTFYPEDSRLLIDTVNDDDMLATAERKQYILYWDETVRDNVASGAATNVSGSLYLGNERVGRHNITSLSGAGASQQIPKKAIYNYESMRVGKVQVTEIVADESGAMPEFYDDVKDVLMAKSGMASIVADIDGTFPMTGNIKLDEQNIRFDLTGAKIRFLWNYTMDSAVARLVNFIEYALPDIEPNARKQYAIGLLMNYTRSAEEQTELLALAKDYVKFSNPNFDDAAATRAAYQLLMIDERYDFAKNPNAFKGGANRLQTVEVLIQLAGSSFIYRGSVRVNVLFADFSPTGYYKLTLSGEYEGITGAAGSDLPTSLYISVATSYWNKNANKNAYESAGKLSPYDNISTVDYKLLDIRSRRKSGLVSVAGENKRLIHVTDIEYVFENEMWRSASFKIDGIKYKSNLIALNASREGK